MLDEIVHSVMQFNHGAAYMSKLDKFEAFVEQARKRRDQLKKELEIAEQIIDGFERLLREVPREALQATFEDVEMDAIERFDPSKSFPVPPSATPDAIAREAKKALLSEGRPLKRGALVQSLEKRGVPLSGKDRNKNLGTILWRHPNDFLSLEGLGYWVKGVPLEGVYDPEEHAKKEEEEAYAQYREMKFEYKRIEADQGSAALAARREMLLMEQGRLAERYPSFPHRWQADHFR